MSKTILLVEDDRDLLDLMTQKLSNEGFTVQGFDTGGAALEYLKSHTPDMAILDVLLPDIDGLTILSEIAKSKHLKKMPALILSNLADEASIEQAIAVGPQYEYLVKSRVPLNELVKKIKKTVGG